MHNERLKTGYICYMSEAKNPEKFSKSQVRTLNLLRQRLQELPALRSVVARIAAMNPHSTEFIEQVADLSRLDPPFGLKLIHLANGARYGSTEPVFTLSQALSRIGAEELGAAIVTLGLADVFDPKNQKQRNLWIHSIQVAVAARKIALLLPEQNVKAEIAYTAGLLHDIGRFVLYRESIEELAKVDEIGTGSAEQLIRAERAICGFDHTELGWHACKQWSLPEQVGLYVKYHHYYQTMEPRSFDPALIALIRMVQLADRVSFLFLSHPKFSETSEAERKTLVLKACALALPYFPKFPVENFIAALQPILNESQGLSAHLKLEDGLKTS
jgi:putative nucleotidyltransferase with HDIG domain